MSSTYKSASLPKLLISTSIIYQVEKEKKIMFRNYNNIHVSICDFKFLRMLKYLQANDTHLPFSIWILSAKLLITFCRVTLTNLNKYLTCSNSHKVNVDNRIDCDDFFKPPTLDFFFLISKKWRKFYSLAQKLRKLNEVWKKVLLIFNKTFSVINNVW